MAQASFAELEHDLKKRRTRRELFLEKMNRLVPWDRLERRIEPFYPKAGRGRRPYPLSVMLRVHCAQLFYNLSDPGMEDLLYEVESVSMSGSEEGARQSASEMIETRSPASPISMRPAPKAPAYADNYRDQAIAG